MKTLMEPWLGKIERRPALFLFAWGALLVAVKYLAILEMKVPSVWGDEYRYLGRAMHLAQSGVPFVFNISGPDYPPLVSFLLTPAFLIDTSAIWAYRYALLINSVVSSLAIWPLWLILRRLDLRNRYRLAIIVMVTLCTSYFYYSVIALSENTAYFLLFWLWLTLASTNPASKGDFVVPIRGALLAGLLSGLLILARTYYIILLPVVGLYFLWPVIWPALRRREWGSLWDHIRDSFLAYFGYIFTALIFIVLWKLYSAQVLSDHNIISPLNRYLEKDITGYNSNKYLNSLLGIANRPGQFLEILYYHLVYIISGSFFLPLVALFLYRTTNPTKPKPIGGKSENDFAPNLFRFLVILSLFVFILAILHNYPRAHLEPKKYTVYGRYIDPLTPFFLFAGLYLLFGRHRNWSPRDKILLFVLGVALIAAIPDLRLGFRRVNWTFANIIDDTGTRQGVLIVVYTFVFLSILAWTWRPGKLTMGTYLSFVLAITIMGNIHMSNHTAERSREQYERWELSGEIRRNQAGTGLPVLVDTQRAEATKEKHGHKKMFGMLWNVYFLSRQPPLFINHEDLPALLKKNPRGVYYITDRDMTAKPVEADINVYDLKLYKLVTGTNVNL